MRQRILKAVTYLVIFFFTWTMGGMFNIAYAAYHEIQKPSSKKKQEQRPEEKFQKAIDDLRNIVSGKSSFETKRSKLREKRDAIESLDKEIKSQFADTENKLKKAGLPQEILQRHYNFVKHYEANLKELRANLDTAENSKTDREFENNSKKICQHLEKTSFKKKHTPLDPNKLPHRLSDIKRKEPRTKPEQFKKDLKQKAAISGQPSAFSSVIPQLDWGIQPSPVIPAQAGIQSSSVPVSLRGDSQSPWQSNNQPLLLASTGPLTGLVEKLPQFESSQNLPQPLFYPKGHTSKEGSNSESNFNSFNSPPFIKGDTGGFSTNVNEPITLALAHDTPTAADLAETIDVQLTPAIRAKAAELNYSPVKIYNWVRNNVEYVPTYGSIQGADMCLQTLQGNDFDIASLLIALLRASNIHARYVYGTIELPIDKVMNWVGGFTNANSAVNFIASGGTPVEGLISGGKISSVRMEHVWVEAFVKYYPLRGAKHITGQGDSWIPLDASYKQYNYTQGIDIKSVVPFDAQTFVNQIKSTATIDEANSSVTNINSTYIQQQMQSYQNQVKVYIEQNYPNATVGDVLGKKEIIKQDFSFLAGTLPYQKSMIGVRYSEIPDSLRQKITFELKNPSSYASDFTYTISLPALSQERITLSYSPATQNDKNVILSAGDSNSVSAYLVNLRPELKIDGVTKATGLSIGMGTTENFIMTFIMPGNMQDAVANDVIAGEYYAIAINHGVMNEALVQNRANKLNATNELFKSGQFNGILLDDVIGESLNVLAASYFFELDTLYTMNAKVTKIASARFPSEAIMSQGLNISYLYSTPYIASLGTMSIDFDRDIRTVVAMDGNNNTKKEYMSSTGTLGSALEHSIFEQAFPDSEAISAVKALNIANSSGIPIYQINKDNVSQILPQLQVSNEVKTDIVNSINAGKEVTISKTNISLSNWTGVGYIVKDLNTGAAAYLISGGMAGADFIEEILEKIDSLFVATAEASEGTQNDQANLAAKAWATCIFILFLGAIAETWVLFGDALIGALAFPGGTIFFFCMLPTIICIIYILYILIRYASTEYLSLQLINLKKIVLNRAIFYDEII